MLEAAAPRTREQQRLFDPGVLSRLRTRLLIILAYVAAAIPAGLFRGKADNLGMAVHWHFNALESVVFWDGPSRALQAGLLDVRPVQYLSTWIYASWFFLPLFATMPLVGGPGARYWRLLGVLILTYYAGMPFFALFPLAPPWAHDTSIAHVLALVNPGIANKDDNPFAAMPSLHVALPAAAALWYGLRTAFGRAMLGYSLLIAVTVMYTGDHYLADILAGYTLAAVVSCALVVFQVPLRDPVRCGDGKNQKTPKSSSTTPYR